MTLLLLITNFLYILKIGLIMLLSQGSSSEFTVVIVLVYNFIWSSNLNKIDRIRLNNTYFGWLDSYPWIGLASSVSDVLDYHVDCWHLKWADTSHPSNSQGSPFHLNHQKSHYYRAYHCSLGGSNTAACFIFVTIINLAHRQSDPNYWMPDLFHLPVQMAKST